MDSSSVYPFSANAPFRQPIVIIHIASMATGFLGFYPFALIQGIRRHRKWHFVTVITGTLFALIGLVTGWLIRADTVTFETLLLRILGSALFVLLLLQITLGVYKAVVSKGLLESPSYYSKLSFIGQWLSCLPAYTHLGLGWCILFVAYGYMVGCLLFFTENVTSATLLCIAIGSGFLGYGMVALLHLMNIFKLPRASTPEYYEGLLMTLWGIITLLNANVPILGSDWCALNLGLLWLTGGIFSVTLSMQTWMTALRERNILNAIIICFTGKAILAGSNNDEYAVTVHTMLGSMMMIGAVARIFQIIFRRSPADNLPRLISRASGSVDPNDAEELYEDDDEDEVDPNRRANIYRSTYQQLTGQHIASCKHTSVFASITVACGLLAALMAMTSGFLFIGASADWIAHMHYYLPDPITYVNIVVALAFLWGAYIMALCTIYKTTRTVPPVYEYLSMTEVGLPSTVQDVSALDIATCQRETAASGLSRSRSLPSRGSSHRQDSIEQRTMRPSQYRAKRRSLLVSSPTNHRDTILSAHKGNRARSSSCFGVGGVLPDELHHAYAISDSSGPCRSWLSNGSATSAASAVSSVSFASSLSTDSPQRASLYTDYNHVTSPAEDSFPDHQLSQAYMRKTESGRRKERQHQMKTTKPHSQYSHVTGAEDAHSSNNSSSSSFSESGSIGKYYATERNSSDSHVCQ
ncbi:uncharacterized protein BYT42DRAFT_580286 [Radiomyces spectabilis]|uniref:uncharacterized protein n=1 Tax=Radiomyces spectabilis TaxID=64574 RepID=UPI00221FD539|nr:uncharacterized protein BYT42DRAFT_580286 [Radiomyces spectabilis]KAI8371451.1 hypothetical protein BYT42DRAFT_580286 [Radiomyces spectabilis]